MKTKPEEWFCTEQEAVKAGFKKSGDNVTKIPSPIKRAWDF